MKLLLPLFALTALCLYGVTLMLLIRAKRTRSRCFPCMGTIIRFEEDWNTHVPGEHHRRRLTPIVAYMVDGRVYETKSNYYATGMRVGQQLKLLCDREDPSKATTSGGVRLAALVTGGLAVFFTVFTALLALVLPTFPI